MTASYTSLTGSSLLGMAHLNKGSAFTTQGRQEFGLVGLLPSSINSLNEQAERALEQYRTHRTDIGRNIFLTSIKEQNTVLYYRLLQDHLKEMFSVIYTPTEGEAIANYSRIFRTSEGCFLNIASTEEIELALSHWEGDDIDIIACSDGEQILGMCAHTRPLQTFETKFIHIGRHWRSRRWRHTYQRCQASALHYMRRNRSTTYSSRGARRRNRQRETHKRPFVFRTSATSHSWKGL